ncbi:MAG TPA: YbaK/EbsC family protein [Candidatus Competibacteraceae bacterium]|nr:YbaK/EbsC family protein [Candidatus Competibacteraceae bacterium]
MAIASTLQSFMREHQCQYDVVRHPHSACSMETVHNAHVPGECLAKSVILVDNAGKFLMAVLPADHQVDLELLNQQTQRWWRLAHEHEFAALFRDCELGAIPPIGSAYGLETVIDEQLTRTKEIYFEAGDHEELIHMRTDQFLDLMPGAMRLAFSRRLM